MGISYFESSDVATIPSFVTARTPRGLRRSMQRNNIKHRGFVVYQDIQWVESDGLWYAWFYVKDESLEALQDEEEGADE